MDQRTENPDVQHTSRLSTDWLLLSFHQGPQHAQWDVSICQESPAFRLLFSSESVALIPDIIPYEVKKESETILDSGLQEVAHRWKKEKGSELPQL